MAMAKKRRRDMLEFCIAFSFRPNRNGMNKGEAARQPAGDAFSNRNLERKIVEIDAYPRQRGRDVMNPQHLSICSI